MLCHWHRTTW